VGSKSTIARDHHKNKTIFKLLVNKMPVRRIIEVTDIAPQTFYHRLAFFHRQCQAFAAHRERALANLAIRRLYLVYVPLVTRGYLPLFRSGTKITPS